MRKRGVNFCRGCNGEDLFLGLSLGESPLANNLLNHPDEARPVFPLELRVCLDCGLGQVGEFETPEAIFSDYPYLSSTSKTWVESNKSFADEIRETEGLGPSDFIIELASNDGYLLKSFQKYGHPVLGVEPAKNIAEMAIRDGVPTIPEFFGLGLAKKMRLEFGVPKVIIAKNVVAHVPDLKDFISGIAELAGSETLVVVEAPTISQILSGGQFDTVYHEHFSYLSGLSLEKIFADSGMFLVGAQELTSHGGSVRFFIRKDGAHACNSVPRSDVLQAILESERSLGINKEESWVNVRDQVRESLKDFHLWLSRIDPEVATVAYGAAAKGVTLLAACGALPGAVDYVIDNSNEKAGKYFPIVGSPIMEEASFVNQMNGRRFRYVVFPWNLVDEIVPRVRMFDSDSEIVVAVPSLKIVT